MIELFSKYLDNNINFYDCIAVDKKLVENKNKFNEINSQK